MVETSIKELSMNMSSGIAPVSAVIASKERIINYITHYILDYTA